MKVSSSILRVRDSSPRQWSIIRDRAGHGLPSASCSWARNLYSVSRTSRRARRLLFPVWTKDERNNVDPF